MRRPTPLLIAALVIGGALVAACGGGDKAQSQRVLGGITFNDHGTKTAGGGELALEVDSFYFSPTFIQGQPGGKLILHVTNDSSTPHNVSIQAQKVDKDVPAKGKVDVEVTVPASGAVMFFCKFHTGSGMNGELLPGNATPQAIGAASGASSGGSNTGY